MELAPDTVQAAPEELEALQEAFRQFTRQTAQLQEAYQQLKERAEQVNTELEAANRELERKVRELDEAYNFQRSILESIPTAVVVTDLEGIVRTVNPAAARMWGLERQEAVGRHYTELMQPHHGLLERVLEGEHTPQSERRELDGPEPQVISSTACLVQDSDGRPIGAVQLDRDISRLCSLRVQLYRQGKLADLGKMAAGLAHEIRKPLNGIKGFASLLERKVQEEPAPRRYVGNIVGAVDRLDDLLHRLLDFARPDELRLATCDLRAEARQVAEFVRAGRAGQDAEVTVRVPEDARWVRADADKLKQVLLNLMQNGMDALAEGKGRVRVETETVRADGEPRVAVRVADTGCGMTPEQVERALEPFYTDKEGGTGLGLCIVHRILQLHGAELEVDSRPADGTTMSFLLPAAPRPEDR